MILAPLKVNHYGCEKYLEGATNVRIHKIKYRVSQKNKTEHILFSKFHSSIFIQSSKFLSNHGGRHKNFEGWMNIELLNYKNDICLVSLFWDTLYILEHIYLSFLQILHIADEGRSTLSSITIQDIW
jgi:hypothetical protein